MATSSDSSPGIRWWPAFTIIGLGGIAFALIQHWDHWAYEQVRSYCLIGTTMAAIISLILWWGLFSRARRVWRISGSILSAVTVGLTFMLLLRGLSGDFVPDFAIRFTKPSTAAPTPGAASTLTAGDIQQLSYPQFLGPKRDGKPQPILLDPNWATRPPQLIWRRSINAAWSGFAIHGGRIYTMEQQGELEAVTCYELLTGNPVWSRTNPGRYATAIAGEGPRTTPTIHGDRIFTLGATGILQCLQRDDGKLVWSRDLKTDAASPIPEWGFASSPLIVNDTVVVSASGNPNGALLAYRILDGTIVWQAGHDIGSYGSPSLFEISGTPQIVSFNKDTIASHDTKSGAILWEHPWGTGKPHVAAPIQIAPNRLLFSSGYGVGSALLEITPQPMGPAKVQQLWKTIRFQAKFSNPVQLGAFVYGISDGIFACLDLADGTVRWKDGRYGHGQGLLVNELMLLMSEQGELVLLRPTPNGANECGKFPIFDSKSWNPIALAGPYALVRNDREAACVLLPTVSQQP